MAKESRVKTYSRKTKKGLTLVKSHLKRNKKKILASAATLGALGIGYAALRRKKMLRMQNPKIVKPNVTPEPKITHPTIAGLIPERTGQARAKSNYVDTKGKQRKKGQMLPGIPKGESSIILEPTTTKERVVFDVNSLEIFDPEYKKGKIKPSERNIDLIAEAKALREIEKRRREKLGPRVDFKPKDKNRGNRK